MDATGLKRLADAIRLGCEIAPLYCSDGYCRRDTGGEMGADALGAAWLSLGREWNPEGRFRPEVNLYFALEIGDAFPALRRLCDAIFDLDHKAGWSRERIADWIESLGAP